MKKKLHNPIWNELVCLVAGALLTLAFAPFGIFPIAILAPAVLLFTWLNASKARAFWRGWLFGLGFFGTGVSWIFISIHTYGATPIWLATLITLLFVALMALYPAFTGYALNRFFPKPNTVKILCAFPALWVFIEWIRSWLFTGFPWLFLGYSQIDSPLKGYAPFMSVYAVSLAVALSSALVVYAMIAFQKRRYLSLYLSLLGLAVIWILGAALSFISWTTPNGKAFQASLVQGNIPQELKWSPEHAQATLNIYQKLTDQHWDSQIIIWPEGAIPLTLQSAGGYLGMMANKALRHHAVVITGLPIQASNHSYFNAVLAIGQGSGLYMKERLVPFGEFTPFQRYFGKLFTLLQIPMANIIPGIGNHTPIVMDNIKFATFICYEIAYPEQVLRQDGTAGILLTVTDDAWFDRSIAQAQHLEIARMRAYEMGRPLLFVSNNGITAFVTPSGKIQSAAPPYEQAVLTDSVQPMQGKTPWVRFGMDPILLVLILLLVGAWRFRGK